MRVVTACVAIALCGCGSSPAAPTSPAVGAAPASSSAASTLLVTLSGHVTDVESGAPITGAVVTIVDTPGGVAANIGRTTVTDSTGYYAINGIVPANNNLGAAATGYAERRTGFRIMSDAVLDWQLRLVQPARPFTISLSPSHTCVGTTLDQSTLIPLPAAPPPPPIITYECQTVTLTLRRQGPVDLTLQWPPQNPALERRVDSDAPSPPSSVMCRSCPNPWQMHTDFLRAGTYRFGIGVDARFGPAEIAGLLAIQD